MRAKPVSVTEPDSKINPTFGAALGGAADRYAVRQPGLAVWPYGGPRSGPNPACELTLHHSTVGREPLTTSVVRG